MERNTINVQISVSLRLIFTDYSLELLQISLRYRVSVLDCRVFTAFDFSFILGDSFQTLIPDVAVFLDEFGKKSTWRKVPRHVPLYQYLPRASIPWHQSL